MTVNAIAGNTNESMHAATALLMFILYTLFSFLNQWYTRALDRPASANAQVEAIAMLLLSGASRNDNSDPVAIKANMRTHRSSSSQRSCNRSRVTRSNGISTNAVTGSAA